MIDPWTYHRAAAQIRAIADAAGGVLRVALGSTGGTEEVAGEDLSTGRVWAGSTLLDTFLLGLGAALDATYRARLNELIAAYNQLRTDYNAATVPTTAREIAPLT